MMTGPQCTFASRMKHTEDRKLFLSFQIFCTTLNPNLFSFFFTDTEVSELMKQAGVSFP